MRSKQLALVTVAFNALRAKCAAEAHDKALSGLSNLCGEHREIFDWLEPALKRKQDNMPMSDNQEFAAFNMYRSQFKFMQSIYFERIPTFKRKLFTWGDLYAEAYPSINSSLITKMAAVVNDFCVRIKESLPGDPQKLLELQPNANDVKKAASWEHSRAEFAANFDVLDASVSECYRAALLKDLADCRREGSAAVEKFRVQTKANLIYVEEKTEIQATQIEAFNLRIGNLLDEAVQAIRCCNEEQARDALMRKICTESSKTRYEDEGKTLFRLGTVLKEILSTADY